MGSDKKRFRTKHVGPLFLIKEWVERLGFQKIIDKICPSEPQCKLSLGEIAEVLVINRLCSPRPLYDIQRWAQETGLEQVCLIDPDLLNDDKLGRSLERLAENAGILKGEIAIEIANKFQIGLDYIHWDITTAQLEGDYAEENDQQEYIRICYAKQGDRTTKAFKVGLDVANDGKGPVAILYDVFDGNITGYEATIINMETLKKYIKPQKIIRISDCGCFSAEIVAKTVEQGFDLISTVKMTQGVKNMVIEILQKNPVFERLSFVSKYQRYKKASEQQDGYSSLEIPYQVEYNGKVYPLRLFIVKSDGKVKRDQKSRQKHIAWIEKELKTLSQKVGKRGYGAKRIQRALKKIINKYPEGKIFHVNLEYDAGAIKSITYHIDKDELHKLVMLEGIYLVATTLPLERYSMDSVFTIYKQQYAVENANKIIKGPIKLKPVYLHKAQKIEGLLFILWLSLLAYMLLEREYRQRAIKQVDKTRTSKWILQSFEHYCIIEIVAENSTEYHFPEFNERQAHIYEVLGMQMR